MKALAYLGPNQKSLEDRPQPHLKGSGDAIVKMLKTTICDTDLHILKGDVATCAPGRVLDHEGVGVVGSLDTSVTRFRPWRPRAGFVHIVMRELRLLPSRHVFALLHRRLDPRQRD